MTIQTVNPANNKPIKTYQLHAEEEVINKLEQASLAWQNWRKTSFAERKKRMLKAADVLREEKSALAELMALEMGKPITDGIAEIEKCAKVCEYYANHSENILKDDFVVTEASKSYVSYQSLGVVLAIMPWNFPFWQSFRFLAPALMAGNCCVLKHASNVPGCALAIEEIILKAGFPNNVFHTLLIKSGSVKRIIDNPVIEAITLTGSTQAGMEVAKQAGSLIKKTVLELGGSDPYIILEDADLDYAARACAQSRLINNGQSCISAKRFIVVEQVEKEFTSLLKKYMEEFIIGDPLDEKTQLGPMAKVTLRDELHEQVEKSIEQGAECILGGKISPENRNNAFYPPTILTNVKKGMVAYEEELFGPVATVICVKDADEAIRVANDTVFGLGAGIFTKNSGEGERIAREELQAGSCFVNTFVKSDSRLPFGGIKQSGYGRELASNGIKEFVNIKTVVVQ